MIILRMPVFDFQPGCRIIDCIVAACERIGAPGLDCRQRIDIIPDFECIRLTAADLQLIRPSLVKLAEISGAEILCR